MQKLANITPLIVGCRYWPYRLIVLHICFRSFASLALTDSQIHYWYFPRAIFTFLLLFRLPFFLLSLFPLSPLFFPLFLPSLHSLLFLILACFIIIFITILLCRSSVQSLLSLFLLYSRLHLLLFSPSSLRSRLHINYFLELLLSAFAISALSLVLLLVFLLLLIVTVSRYLAFTGISLFTFL